MAHDLVSVIVPTYNRSWCLARAVNSALTQTHANVEVLLVDDGSTDRTPEIVESLYRNEPRVQYIRQDNQGVSGARNTGIKAAQGDFVALLDSDDFWFPWKLEAQLAALRGLPEVGMVWTDMEAINPEGQLIAPCYLTTMYEAFRRFPKERLFSRRFPLQQFAPDLEPVLAGVSVYAGDIFSQMIAGSFVHTSTVVLRRERLEKVGLFNPELKYAGEDFDFHLRTCREGPVALINTSSIQYQCGMEDRLTRDEYKVHFAMSFLKTITPFIQFDRERIQMSDQVIREILAHGHLWAGEAALNGGDSHLAREQLWKCLTYNWAQPRTFALWLAANLPTTVERPLRRRYRSLKSRLLPHSRLKPACSVS